MKMAEKSRKEAQKKAGKQYGRGHPKSKTEVGRSHYLKQPIFHTDKILAKMASVSEGTFYRFEQIKDKINDKTRWDLITGKERINGIYKKIEKEREKEEEEEGKGEAR